MRIGLGLSLVFAGGFIPPPAGQIISPGGIASTEAFGTPVVAGPIIVTGIATAEAFGTPVCNVIQNISPSGIASLEAFGTAKVSIVQAISPSGIASAEAFGSATVASGPQFILASGIYEGVMGTPGVTGGVQEL